MGESNRVEDLRKALRSQAARDDWEGVSITYRISGGVPAEGLGSATARFSFEPSAREGSALAKSLTSAEMRSLVRELEESLGELVPHSEARFVPDSRVGQITVSLGGREATFLFLADEEQAKQQGKVLGPNASRLVHTLEGFQKRGAQNEEEWR